MPTKITDVMPITLRYKFIESDDVMMCQECYKDMLGKNTYVAIVEMKGGHTAEKFICNKCADKFIANKHVDKFTKKEGEINGKIICNNVS